MSAAIDHPILARARRAPVGTHASVLPTLHGIVVVVGAGARVGKTTMVDALSTHAADRGLKIAHVVADLGVRPLAQHGERMRERLVALRETAELLIVDCAGEREALLLAPFADVVVLVTTPMARTLADAAGRLRKLGTSGVERVHVVVNLAETAEAGRVAYSLLRGSAGPAADRIVLTAVVCTATRSVGVTHDGPAARARGERPGWREAAQALVDGAKAPEAALASAAETQASTSLWQRIKRALGAPVESTEGARSA